MLISNKYAKKLNEFKEMPWASLEIYLSQQQQNIIITVAVNSSDGVGEGCADIFRSLMACG